MHRVYRTDGATVRKITKLPTGGIKVEAVLSGPSVLDYGSHKEYRPPEVTFHEDTLASVDGAPVTDEHPSELVNTGNFERLARGYAVRPRRDGDDLVAEIFIQSQSLIDQIDVKREVSLGYLADVKEQVGVTPKGERYDAIQTRIQVNHVAIVSKARSKGAGLRLDSNGHEICAKVTDMDIDAIKAERDAALEKAGKIEAELVSLRKDHEELRATHDAAQEEIKTLPDRAREFAKVIVLAEKHGIEVRADMDENAVRDAVLIKLVPDADLKESVDYKRARLDAALKAKPADPRAELHAERKDGATPADTRPAWARKSEEQYSKLGRDNSKGNGEVQIKTRNGVIQ